uniref:Uncharacterized protein n=1 Tax=Medicago truncatula TaxID=3880 RepID=A2Q4M8_MEDTR|nr:hypothetical protein MtrDRAFT_AC157506g53v2 [Medicago truncatula]
MKEVKTQWRVSVSYTHLKRCYERLLNRCNQFEEPADEVRRTWTCCASGGQTCGSMRGGTSNGSTVYPIVMNKHAPVAEYTASVPPYEEVIVEQ